MQEASLSTFPPSDFAYPFPLDDLIVVATDFRPLKARPSWTMQSQILSLSEQQDLFPPDDELSRTLFELA